MVIAVLFEYVIDCFSIAALTAPFVLTSWTLIALARQLASSSKQGKSHVVTHTPERSIAENGPRSAAELATRGDLAAAYWLVTLNGWDDVVYTHISASVPDEPALSDQSVRLVVR